MVDDGLNPDGMLAPVSISSFCGNPWSTTKVPCAITMFPILVSDKGML